MFQRHSIIFIVVIFLGMGLVFAEIYDPKKHEKTIQELTQDVAKGKPFELEALEIRAKIHEPTVIYILDRRKLEVDFTEETIGFEDRIPDPILDNRF